MVFHQTTKYFSDWTTYIIVPDQYKAKKVKAEVVSYVSTDESLLNRHDKSGYFAEVTTLADWNSGNGTNGRHARTRVRRNSAGERVRLQPLSRESGVRRSRFDKRDRL
ncbi:hypothetical protein GCM10025859_35440 [Alicyclobacillus fastidiosus]|nr:hypothetical protein GCM10025859_35440 [Alicyclobacillus fastidiosus]